MSEDSSKARLEKKKPGTFGSPLRVFITMIVVLLVGQTIALLLVELVLRILGRPTSITDLQVPTFSQFSFVLLSEILVIGLVYFFLRRRGLGWLDIGLGRRPKLSDLWISLAAFGAFYAVLIALSIVIKLLIPSIDVDQAQNVGFEVLNTNADKLLAFVSLVLLAPVGEEVLWRGYFYSGLRSKLKYLPTLLITSVVFGALHLEFGGDEPLNWMAGIATLLLAVVLAYARERTKALYAPIAIHTMNNLVAFVVVFIIGLS